MNPINFVPIMIATISLALASFMRKKDWALIAFVIWLVIFVLTFYIIK